MKLKATLVSAVLLAAWVTPSFAEVQNVKVGGDITVRAFHRSCLDLNCGDDSVDYSASANGVRSEEADDFLMSTVGINVGADLTENVSAFIRIANERDWNVGTNGATNATGDLDLSQAYITLKELFSSPLTLRLGQQPIVWGRGLVLGSNLLPGTIIGTDDRNGSITANEFTDFTAFDALRATLDLGGAAGMPLMVDAVYIKGDENVTANSDDRNIMGINIGTKLDSANAEFETYFLNLRTKDTSFLSLLSRDANNADGSVSTLGFRGSAAPVEGSYVYGEAAYQFGGRPADIEASQPADDKLQAWMFNLGGEYTMTDVAMTPKLGAEWRYYSGKDTDGALMGWQPIAPGYYRTALREFQTRSTVTGFYNNAQTGVTSAQTNQIEWALYGSLKPLEDLTVNQRLSWFYTPVGTLAPSSGGESDREHSLGTEWDTVVSYNYTDDVQFGVIYGVFFPGNIYRVASNGGINGDDIASELITTVGVKF